MDSKLTLNVDKTVANRAKQYARERGRSLSNLVEDYFRLLTRKENLESNETSPKVRSLLGSIKVPQGFNYKKELSDRLSDRFLKE